MAATLRGIFRTSNTPIATASFYRDVAGLPLEQIAASTGYSYWKLDTDGIQLASHDAKQFANYTYPVVEGSNLTHLYFKIDDQKWSSIPMAEK